MHDERLKQEEEQEINLRDYIDIIRKRKKIILVVFLVSVIATAVISFLLPRQYEISMVTELGSVGISEDGQILYLNSVENISAKIEEGSFDRKIREALNIDSPKTRFNFKVSHPKESHLIKISMEQEEKKLELGLDILNQLFNELWNSSNEIFQSKKNATESQISIFDSIIKGKADTITSLNDKIILLEKKENKFASEIEDTKSNRDRLNGQFAAVSREKEAAIAEISSLQAEIANFKIEVAKLNLIKDNISNIKLVREPVVSLYPIRPNKKRNIILASVFSLTFGIFLAFFMELWGPPKK